MSEQGNKPVILWTCDVVGWAYYNRIQRLSKAMPEYEHRIWYFGSRMSQTAKMLAMREADIIVCQGIKAIRIVTLKPLRFDSDSVPQAVLDARYDNLVVRLDSMRVDHEGEYYDIWTGEKLPE